MKIVHVLTRLLRAGAEENTLACCFSQVHHGHEVLLVHGKEFEPSLRASVAEVLPVVTLETLVHPVSARHDLAAVQQLRQCLREWRPDIVHTHQSKAGIIGRLAARRASVPGIIHGVHILPFVHVGPLHKLVYVAAERLVAQYTQAFIDVSQAMREICIAHHIGTPNQHHVVHSGFDLARFAGAEWPSSVHSLLGTVPGVPKPPVVLMLAALEPRKRHVEFIEAFAQVVARVPDVRLLLAGDGPTRPSVEAAVKRSPIGGSIRLIGHHPKPEQLISLADVCVLTSSREGLPRVVMQYLAGGRACVISHLPGVEEVVRHRVNGIVTPADDMNVTAAAVANVLEDEACRAMLAKGAAATDLSSWDVRVMCERVELVYQSVMHSGTRDLNQSMSLH